MIPSNTPWRPLSTAQINWTDDDAPRSRSFDDIYYSPHESIAESQYVFLQGNHLPERWANHTEPSFCIVETGFGTGLNFLLTWQLWQSQGEPRPHLHFLSIEKHPLRKEDMRRALASWPALAQHSAALLQVYPDVIPGQHRLVLEAGAVTLDLWWGDAGDALENMASFGNRTVDAWYLDGFAPDRNRAMWTDDIYLAMAALSKEHASFATFTAAGQVRRGLSEAGFEVSKSPGFGRKRECLRGTIKPGGVPPRRTITTPWDICDQRAPRPRTALVIGAGLAGATVAAALARRNIQVCVLEQGQVACAGSGNDQGVLYTRLSRKHSSLSDFSLQSYGFAHRFYRQLLSSGALREGVDGALCGCFHQSNDEQEMAAICQLVESVPEFARVLSATQASALLGIEQPRAGYWFPNSGWMRPASICHALLQSGNIQLKENTGPIRLEALGAGWAAVSDDASPDNPPLTRAALARADCVVIAAGTAAADFSGLDWLPLQAIRGQTSMLPTTDDFGVLRAALCHRGYISPARQGSHCIGATFDLHDTESATRTGDHRRNLDALAAAVPQWKSALAGVDEHSMTGRVGYRCATPDYLPLVGPIPARAAFLQNYAALSKNARQTIPIAGEYMPGLYLTTGHGSRGLTSTPLAAEILASDICDEPLPLSRELYRAISPARFIIRDLRRKRA